MPEGDCEPKEGTVGVLLPRPHSPKELRAPRHELLRAQGLWEHLGGRTLCSKSHQQLSRGQRNHIPNALGSPRVTQELGALRSLIPFP